jgi:predicted dehydrogenase
MKTQSRRNFLKTSLFAAGTVAWTAKSWSQVAGANSTVRAATVGFNSRGNSHIGAIRKLGPEGFRLVGLCDVDSKVLDRGLKAAKDKDEDVKGHRDMRELFDRKDVDVVTIATPNHWHSLAAIWAIQAGKDVYCEKPVSNNVWEGRKIVEAARKYNRMVQTGTQSRASHAIREAVAWVQAGNLGKVKVARGLCYKPRGSIGKTEGDQPVPETIDYNLWCGPAPLTPPRRNSKSYGPVHYDWHWFWAYGSGDLGNQGIHQMDIARWFVKTDQLSSNVLSVGGRLGYEDDAETPNTQIVYHDYGDMALIFEVRGLPRAKGDKEMDTFMGGKISVIIHCEGGHVVVPNYESAKAVDNDGKTIKEWREPKEFDGTHAHFENLLQVVKSRKYTDLNADIWEGHLSSALCHSGNVSYRLGAKASVDEALEKIKSQKDGEATFQRMLEHLQKNEVDLAKDKLTLGLPLTMDARTEKFIGNKDADLLLRREYRAPFVVPDQV